MSLGPEDEKTAVVKTLSRCEVVCSTVGCEGLERLHEGELVKICHHVSGEDEGKTFVAHAAAECTPTASNAVSRIGSRIGSRAVSRAPSRPQSPSQT